MRVSVDNMHCGTINLIMGVSVNNTHRDAIKYE